MTKNLYCIRHGRSLHNELFDQYGPSVFTNPVNIDTPLLPQGLQQAQELSNSWGDKNHIEYVLVSPLTRTLQTAECIFKDLNIPIVAYDYLKEYPQGLHTCNQRSNKSLLLKAFPNIDFSNITSELDQTWWRCGKEESIEELEIRIDKLKKHISQLPYNNIALISHSGFIGQMKDQHIRYIENGDTELQYCHPYIIKL